MAQNGDRNTHSTRPVEPAASPSRRAYSHRLDVVVLAGTHENPRRLIGGRNKAFLEIAGRPLVKHVVDALLKAPNIRDVFAVGPPAELGGLFSGVERVHCVPQEGKMLANAWAGIRASESGLSDLPVEKVRLRPMLFISSDLPLITPEAIDDFIARCAEIDGRSGVPHAMLTGVSERSALEPFHGTPDQPGIERPFVQLAEGRFRLANIYVARPRQMAHQDFLQTGFSLRKAKDWRNVLRLTVSLFRQPGGWGAAWLTLRLQAAAMLSKRRGPLYRWIRAGNTGARVEKGVSTVLGGPVRIVDTPFGGLSLDVDEEEDFRILSQRYDEWMEIMKAVAEREAAQPIEPRALGE